ncbi:MAG: PAS domain S-box protein [Candidatus Krumholzibacteriota bacterium]|nr:PAS domain S-box protein [Candidatus Krumholzibacteriota bacterium]
MLKTQSLVLLAVIYSVLIVLSAVTHTHLLFVIPAGILVTLAMALRERNIHRKRIDEIQRKLSNLRSEGLMIEEKIKEGEGEGDVFYKLVLTLLRDLERSLFKLVEKNIQLLSLKEIGRSIISSLDESKLIDSVFDYLIHGVGYREAAFLLLRKNKECFQAIVCIENDSRVFRRVVNLGMDDIDGVLLTSLLSEKSMLIKDASMHKMLESGHETLFPDTTMTSFICMPLVMTAEVSPCCTEDGCCHNDQAPDDTGKIKERRYMGSAECLACAENPIMGAIIVTDGFRGTPLTNIDQVTIETVGSLVASNIENWMLYQELRQEEIFREKILESMQHGLFVTDTDGNITLANRSALEMSGYEEESIRKLTIDALLLSEAENEKRGGILGLLDKKSPTGFYESFLKRSDGTHIPLRINISRMYGNDGEIQGAIILFSDLSEVKRMEEAIRQMDKLALLGRFTFAIAHEIRNPLTGIGTGIQYLQRKGGLSEEQTENISFILKEVERLNRIITDLFKVARPRDLLYQKIILKDLIERSCRSFREDSKARNISLNLHIKEDPEDVEVDADQITQVIINLVKNAVEAVSDGGSITIRAGLYEGGDPDVLKEKINEMICMEIEDDGQGIEKTDINKIFEPFFSKKATGTGLGLFVTHSIIQHHQGRISVLSKPGEGTTFKVYLPVTRPLGGEKVETGSTSGR